MARSEHADPRGCPLRRRCVRQRRRTSAGRARPVDRRGARHSTRSPRPPTSTRPSPRPTAALPGWAGATPAERSDAAAPLAAALERMARGPRPGRDAASPASRSGSPRVRRARHDRQHRLLRGRGPAPGGRWPPASTPATTPRTSAASPSASSARSRRGTTRCRWPPGRSSRRSPRATRIVLKPAELTPLTSLMFAEAAQRGGHPGRRGQRRRRARAGGRRAPGGAPATSP